MPTYPVSISDLPEITEDALTEEMLDAGLSEPGPFYKQYKCIFGFVAQTCYMYVFIP
jgi:MFS transporter, FHS family, L-fucose permease